MNSIAVKDIVNEIKNKTKKEQGKCLDVCGTGGDLGLSMAQATNLEVILLDKYKNTMKMAKRRAIQWGISSKITTILGDVQSLPFDDNSFELVVSRGSVLSWIDRQKGFQEIFRVLKANGVAYIGDVETKKKNVSLESLIIQLSMAGIKNFKVSDDEKGLWLIINK